MKIDMNKWSIQNVKECFEEYGLSNFSELFLEQEVDGEVLLELDDEDQLKNDFGISCFGDVKKLKNIQSLQKK